MSAVNLCRPVTAADVYAWWLSPCEFLADFSTGTGTGIGYALGDDIDTSDGWPCSGDDVVTFEGLAFTVLLSRDELLDDPEADVVFGAPISLAFAAMLAAELNDGDDIHAAIREYAARSAADTADSMDVSGRAVA